MGQRTQVKKVLADVESKLADLDAKLDANELEKDEVQVILTVLNFLNICYNGSECNCKF